MSEHPGLEFASQKLRYPILPSMPPLVLFIISMKSSAYSKQFKVAPYSYSTVKYRSELEISE